MGTFSHLSDTDIAALRDKLTQALTDRLTGATVHGWGDKRIQFGEQSADQIKSTLAEVNAEIDGRAGRNQRRPIYLV